MQHIRIKEVDDKELEFLKNNFTCYKCAECCKMKVVINNYDIKKIEERGHVNFYEDDPLGRKVLKIVDGYCIFLKKEDNRFYCEVYGARPKGCQEFPFFENKVMECTSLDKSRFKFQ